jgi:hypothetical protein
VIKKAQEHKTFRQNIQPQKRKQIDRAFQGEHLRGVQRPRAGHPNVQRN